jgi:hypothetical protein
LYHQTVLIDSTDTIYFCYIQLALLYECRIATLSWSIGMWYFSDYCQKVIML